MLSAFTLIHICLVVIFAVLGLKALIYYRGAKVTVQVAYGEKNLISFKYADILFVFACLCYLSFDATSMEYIVSHKEKITNGTIFGWEGLLFSLYLTALVCALFHCARGTVIILYNFVRGLFNKGDARPSK